MNACYVALLARHVFVEVERRHADIATGLYMISQAEFKVINDHSERRIDFSDPDTVFRIRVLACEECGVVVSDGSYRTS